MTIRAHGENLSRAEPTGKELPTIVFIHGGGISSWMWRQPIAALAGFQGLAVELPGHGASPLPWTTVPDAARVVAQFIRSRLPGGRAHVIGLSLGGVVAVQLLAHDPDVVDRMLVSGTLAVGLPGAGFLAKLSALSLPLGKIGVLARLSARTLAIPKEDYPNFMADLERLEADALRRMVLDVANFRPPPELADRPHEVLVVAGSKEHPRIRQSVTTLAALMPNGRGVIIPGGIHTWNWQFPERFNELLQTWFRGGVIMDFATKST